MDRSLLSIDWDYFICIKNRYFGSYIENKRTTVDLWYKRYIQLKKSGKSIYRYFQLSTDYNRFWDRIKRVFNFDDRIKAYVSDSHSLSYCIAKDFNCDSVYLFDAHSDLGYGSSSFYDFEVNCANWLGKLLVENIIKNAYIIYSPYTFEKPDDFKYMNNKYNIIYLKPNDLTSNKINITALHICRSGAWVPPWYDDNFIKFVNGLGISYEIVNCPKRKWNTDNLTLSDELYYMLV